MLWLKNKTDVGYIKPAELIHVKVKQGARLPYQRQHPLRHHAIDRIRSTIKDLVNAGALETKSSCKTPIFPIKKPHSNDYQLVHDLRAIKSIGDVPKVIVPDNHTILSNIPPGTKWHTVVDLFQYIQTHNTCLLSPLKVNQLLTPDYPRDCWTV